MTILDSLEAAEKAMAEKIDFDDMDSIRRVTDARKEYDRLLDEHSADLIAVARAAQARAETLEQILDDALFDHVQWRDRARRALDTRLV